MRDFAFAGAQPQMVPTHKRSTFGIAVAIHGVVLATLIFVRMQPVRVVSDGAPQGSIAPFIMVTTVSATPAAPAKPKEAKTALKTEPAKEKTEPADTTQAAQSAGVVGAQTTPAGPVRIGAGGDVKLLRKVQPVYPAMMQSARITGQVVLDAVIHADGTIGDVTVLQTSNAAFTKSAVDAVKQWKYAPIGYEAILTVNVSFTLT
jgi:TonB family protein